MSVLYVPSVQRDSVQPGGNLSQQDVLIQAAAQMQWWDGEASLSSLPPHYAEKSIAGVIKQNHWMLKGAENIVLH